MKHKESTEINLQSNIAISLLYGALNEAKIAELTDYFEQFTGSAANMISLHDFMAYLKTSDSMPILIEWLNVVERTEFKCSAAHGRLHTWKVVLYAYYLAIRMHMEKGDLGLLLMAACYHDIGRMDDSENLHHGIASVKWLEKNADCEVYKDSVQEDELHPEEAAKALCFLIEAHACPDGMMPFLLEESGVYRREKCMQMAQILKDADALDRQRFHIKALDTRYLRTEAARELQLAAFLLNHLLLESYLQNTKPHFLYHTTFDNAIETLYPTKNLDMYGEHMVEAVFATSELQIAYMYVLHGADIPLYSFGHNGEIYCFVGDREKTDMVFREDKSWLYQVPSEHFQPVISKMGEFGREWISTEAVDVQQKQSQYRRTPITFRDLQQEGVHIYYAKKKEAYRQLRGVLVGLQGNFRKKEMIDYWLMQEYIYEYGGVKL